MPTVAIRNRVGKTKRVFGEGLIEPETAGRELVIRGIAYGVEAMRGDDGTSVVRLSKRGGNQAVYDVSRSADGLVRCDCPAYTFACEGTAETCKHGSACIEAGLIAPASPVRRWTDADHKRARYFGLNVPPQERRTFTPAVKAEAAAPCPVAVVEPIAVEETEPAIVPTAPDADRRFFGPSAEDEAYHSAFNLARNGANAAPRPGLRPPVRDAFLLGVEDGERQREADLQAEADEMDGRAASYADSEWWLLMTSGR